MPTSIQSLLDIYNYNTMSFTELLQQLKTEDEVLLLELLEIRSEDLVDVFLDKIKEKVDKIYRYYD
jgi:hypothetical protein